MPHYQCRLQACLGTLNGPDPGLSPQSLKLNQSLGHSVVGAHYALGVLAGHERLVLSKPAEEEENHITFLARRCCRHHCSSDSLAASKSCLADMAN